jgi:hypothetical protein
MLKPRTFKIRPIAAAVTPFPTELTTPPVKKIYLVGTFFLFRDCLRIKIFMSLP